MNGKEIVITGLGVVSPIANELNLFWEELNLVNLVFHVSKVWMTLISFRFRLLVRSAT